ncbi:MAG: GNAT family N-acetyltransferase [Candidatus Dormibacteraeota bacterium]|nr:GNAT family N-acetyltransferase [Candidatus Dormibacteraeota bacterium]MBO0761412.1 GNAT family N-acetyltransferase [Candidatus Dormibacteraeota bacterium]
MSGAPRPVSEFELPEFVRQLGEIFEGDPPPPDVLHSSLSALEIDRAIGIFDGGRLVATAAAHTLPLSLPGSGWVSGAAVTAVTVQPTHRRRGLLTSLMRHQLDDVRARGEPVAFLWASEAPIYGRFGYGLGCYSCSLEVARPWSAFREAVDLGGLRYVDRTEALEAFPALAAAAARGRPGFVQRSPGLWQQDLADHPSRRGGSSHQYLVQHAGAAGPDGYAIYRKRMPAEEGDSGDEPRLHVSELVAASPAAYAALWRHCLDIDLMASVKAGNQAMDEPLRHLLADARAMRVTVADGLWVRLVDVRAALAARTYQVPGTVVLEVQDEFCPWNAGRVRLEAAEEGASCEPADTAEPDVTLSAAALAACYLGGNRLTALAAAGQVAECRSGALARADRMFGWPVAPSCPLVF